MMMMSVHEKLEIDVKDLGLIKISGFFLLFIA